MGQRTENLLDQPSGLILDHSRILVEYRKLRVGVLETFVGGPLPGLRKVAKGRADKVEPLF
jgi:hypothetical protein